MSNSVTVNLSIIDGIIAEVIHHFITVVIVIITLVARQQTAVDSRLDDSVDFCAR